jgi:DNA repair protein RadC
MVEKELILNHPHHRLLKDASSLSNTELLAILVEATPLEQETMTLDFAHQLLEYKGELGELLIALRGWIYHTEEMLEYNHVLLKKVSLEVQKRTLTKVLKNHNAILYSELTNYFLVSELSRREEVVSGLFLNSLYQMIGFEDLFLGSIDDKDTTHRDIIFNSIVNHARRHETEYIIMVRNNFSLEVPKLVDVSLARWLLKNLPSTEMLLLDYWILHGEINISLANQWLL